jgi:AraC-like DNA-binding protein
MLEMQRQKVRDGSELTLEELRKEAYDRIQESSKSQGDVADELGVNRSTVAKAVTKTGTRYSKTQSDIIEHLTDYRVREKIRYRFERTGGEAS